MSLLEFRNVNKSFGPIDVLFDINLQVKAGEVLCLLGDNGAGKSTLIRLMSGVHQPTSGQILTEGQPVDFPSPAASLSASSRPGAGVRSGSMTGNAPMRLR